MILHRTRATLVDASWQTCLVYNARGVRRLTRMHRATSRRRTDSFNILVHKFLHHLITKLKRKLYLGSKQCSVHLLRNQPRKERVSSFRIRVSNTYVLEESTSSSTKNKRGLTRIVSDANLFFRSKASLKTQDRRATRSSSLTRKQKVTVLTRLLFQFSPPLASETGSFCVETYHSS